jgi:hypothetical protein
MPLPSYEELHDETWIGLIQEKYAREISQLKLMRFTDVYFIRQTGQPFSIFPMLARIVLNYVFGSGDSMTLLRVGDSLSAVAYQPYVVHIDGYAYGAVGYQRIKFATMFDDGTLLQTVNHRGSASHNDRHRFIAQFCLTETGQNGGFKDTWRMHIQRAERLAKIRATISPLRVSDILQMERRADQIIAGGIPDRWDAGSHKKDED